MVILNALREPGRISKALLPPGVDLMDTATAPSFPVPNSAEFSCSCRVCPYFSGWRRFIQGVLFCPFFGEVATPIMKETDDICRTRPSPGHPRSTGRFRLYPTHARTGTGHPGHAGRTRPDGFLANRLGQDSGLHAARLAPSGRIAAASF